MKTVSSCLAAAALLLAAAQALAGGDGTPVRADGAWARPTVTGQTAGGAFLRLENRGAGADRLLSARSPVAERVELHRMSMEGDVMQMRQVDGIDLPPGQAVELKPGGLHLMLMGLKRPLEAGSRVPLVLQLLKAGELKVELQVGQPGPAAPAGAHKDGTHKNMAH
jgi:copper(I)-binding protein